MSILFGSKGLGDFPTVLKTDDATYSPWDVIITSTGDSTYSYSLIPSTVNSVAPSNYATVGTGSTASEKYIYLAVTATSNRITSVSVQSSATPIDAPVVLQSVTPSSFNIALGVIGTDRIYYKFVEGKPITATPSVVFESDRSPPIPGLSPRVQWWTWVMSQ